MMMSILYCCLPALFHHPQVTRDVYEELLSRMPPAISWGGLREMERKEGQDHCEYELACSANGCEMVDIV